MDYNFVGVVVKAENYEPVGVGDCGYLFCGYEIGRRKRSLVIFIGRLICESDSLLRCVNAVGKYRHAAARRHGVIVIYTYYNMWTHQTCQNNGNEQPFY